MNKTYRQRRSPVGFPFLGTEETASLQNKVRPAQKRLQEAGYLRVMPASFDFPDTFNLYSDKTLFKTRDRSGTELAMRNDVTVQVIKGFCNQLEYTSIKESEARIYYTVPVFSDSKAEKSREVFQLGAEVIGIDESSAICELLNLANEIMTLDFSKKVTFYLGDIKSYKYLSSIIADKALKEILLSRDFPQFAELLQNVGLNKSESRDLATLLLYPVDILTDISRWNTFEGKVKRILVNHVEFYNNLIESWQTIKMMFTKQVFSDLSIQVEPLLLRSSEYYSGLIFEGYVESCSYAPLRGGCYNSLISDYSNRDLPASGFAIDASSLLK